VEFQWRDFGPLVCDGCLVGLATSGQCEPFDCGHRIQIGREEKLNDSGHEQKKSALEGAFF
jgi:hypothetical protein